MDLTIKDWIIIGLIAASIGIYVFQRIKRSMIIKEANKNISYYEKKSAAISEQLLKNIGSEINEIIKDETLGEIIRDSIEISSDLSDANRLISEELKTRLEAVLLSGGFSVDA